MVTNSGMRSSIISGFQASYTPTSYSSSGSSGIGGNIGPGPTAMSPSQANQLPHLIPQTVQGSAGYGLDAHALLTIINYARQNPAKFAQLCASPYTQDEINPAILVAACKVINGPNLLGFLQGLGYHPNPNDPFFGGAGGGAGGGSGGGPGGGPDPTPPPHGTPGGGTGGGTGGTGGPTTPTDPLFDWLSNFFGSDSSDSNLNNYDSGGGFLTSNFPDFSVDDPGQAAPASSGGGSSSLMLILIVGAIGAGIYFYYRSKHKAAA